MPFLKRKYRKFIFFSCITVVIYSLCVIFYGIGFKKGNLPIAVDSAACFILTGLSLAFRTTYRFTILVRLLAVMVFIWCAMLLIHDFTPAIIPLIFGMAPQAAFCFICLSFSIFFIKTIKLKSAIQSLLHLVTIIASIVIIGHFLNIPEFYHMTFIPMALYTAINFVLLSVAASFINYDFGITGLFTGRLIGNIMARKFFLQMLIVVLIMGSLRIFAHRQQWVSPEFGSALSIVTFLLITLFLIWKTSTRLNKIDERKRQAKENFSIAFDFAPYALILSDNAGAIKLINSQTEKIFGYDSDGLMGKQLEIIIPEKLRNDYISKRDAFFASPRARTYGVNEELFAIRKNGTEFPIELLLTPVRTSTDTFVLATIIDITRRKNQEKIIKKQLIELQFKNEELEQFNYISSHDLQEPLRTVSNYIHMIIEDYPSLEEELKTHLGTMSQSVDRMSEVVKALLNFGKLGSKKKLTLTDCNILVNNVISDLGSLIKKTGAVIEILDEFPIFYTYETELRQLFQNLINNALKFRKKGTIPEIKIGCKKSGNYYEFFVSDNGIGIDSRHSEKIFHIFHKLNKDTDYEGHGIGLANCKKIAEMHGGKIWVESEPGNGSTFKFTILILKNG